MTIAALRKYGLWNQGSVGLSIAAGHETLLYYATHHVGRIVATDIYGEGDFASVGGGEATAEFLTDPAKFAPYPYQTERLKPLWMNALDLKFADHTFDFAYSLSSIEHFGGLKPAIKALQEMHRVIKPGGLVCIAVDCVINGDNTVGFFTPEQVTTLIAESGLELIEEIDWSISNESQSYLIDMLTDDLNTVPHINLTAFGSTFTSLYMVLVKNPRPGSSWATNSYFPLSQTDLAIFDQKIAALELIKPTANSFKSAEPVWPEVAITTNSATLPQTVGPRVKAWLQSYPADQPLVLMLAQDDYSQVLAGLDSLMTNTATLTPVLVIANGPTDDRIQNLILYELAEARFLGLSWAEPLNRAACLNLVGQWAAPRDLVILDSQVLLPPDWLPRLQAAVLVDDNIATASPLTNDESLLSINRHNPTQTAIIRGMSPDQIDRAVQAQSLRLRPLIAVINKYCAYYRRVALEMIGPFDEYLPEEAGIEIDFAQRGIIRGFSHVAADDLFVYYQRFYNSSQNQSFLSQRLGPEKIIRQRYPWYPGWFKEAGSKNGNGLDRALNQAVVALGGYHLAIDGTCLDMNPTGTQFVVAGLTKALAQLPDRASFKLSLVVTDGLPRFRLYGLESLVDEVVTISELQHRTLPAFDIIHRPFQVYGDSTLDFLKRIARRCIITQMDFIYYSNPSYFRTFEQWLEFQNITHRVLNSIDGVAYMSQDAAQAAAHRGLALPSTRQAVTYIGLESPFVALKSTPPPDVEKFINQPFIFLLGNNYQHKNRAYAFKLLTILVEQYNWPGHLVLAGPNVGLGTSWHEEALVNLHHPEIRARIHNVGLVQEEEKQWLLAQTALVLYPSLIEGFGIVPFEAALVGKPTLSACNSAMSELLGTELLYLSLSDMAADAALVWRLLNDPEQAKRQTEHIQAQARRFSWQQVAQDSLNFYKQIMRLPARQVIENSATLQILKEVQTENQRLKSEYQKLEKWATDLNQRLLEPEKKQIKWAINKIKRLL